MKKILSMVLAIMMLVSAIPVAYAAECGACWGGNIGICEVCGNESHCNDCGHCWDCASNDECSCVECTTNHYEAGTQVSYNAEDPDGDGNKDNVAEYTIRVPAKLAPAGSGTVTLEGKWPSIATVTVTAAEKVELVNSISGADKKELAITFPNIVKAGDNTQSVSASATVSVADINAALFGTWEGVFNYQVDYDDGIVDIISFTVGSYEYQAEEGMTWEEWLYSEYDDGGLYLNSWEPVLIMSGDEWVCEDTHTCEIMSGFYTDGTNCVIPSDVIIAGHSYGLHSRYT